ncbi:MAG TPA: hypothetical protein PK020_03930 [Ilumatobacteraceae bacterium]|nr:hypothetical protein [Ilumatobacteraceae bacterium]
MHAAPMSESPAPTMIEVAAFLSEVLGGRIVKSVTRALGIICKRAGIHCTSLTGPDAVIEEDTVISTPTSLPDRGAELNWLLEQAVELLRRLRPDVLYVKKSPGGQRQSSREQHEVEAIVQVAAHRTGVVCAIRTTEQVRAAHVPRGKGAYKQLLERKDVKARGTKSRREGYLYAATALGEPEGVRRAGPPSADL